MRRSDRAKHMRKYYGDILNLDTDEKAIKLWSKKPKFKEKVKEIYIVSMSSEIQKLIDELAKLLDELDEKIDQWF